MKSKMERALSLLCGWTHSPITHSGHLPCGGRPSPGRHPVLLASSKLYGESCRPGPFRVSNDVERTSSGPGCVTFLIYLSTPSRGSIMKPSLVH